MTAAETESEHGFALMGALWAGIVLAIVAVGMTAIVRTDARMVRTRQRRAQLVATDDAAINLAILRLIDPSPGRAPPLDGVPFHVSFDGTDVTVAVRDEAGRIDINMASPDTLRRLLISVGVAEAQADALAERILVWRGAIPTPEPGAYAAAGRPYGPRDGPFESVDEVRLVLGMTAAIFHRIAPLLTVYSQVSVVDVRLAPSGVRHALGLEDSDAAPAQSLTAGMVAGHVLRISASGHAADAAITRIAVIRLTGQMASPFWVYRWQ